MSGKHRENAIRGLTDQQITGMIEALSGQLSTYVKEWDRRLLVARRVREIQEESRGQQEHAGDHRGGQLQPFDVEGEPAPGQAARPSAAGGLQGVG